MGTSDKLGSAFDKGDKPADQFLLKRIRPVVLTSAGRVFHLLKEELGHGGLLPLHLCSLAIKLQESRTGRVNGKKGTRSKAVHLIKLASSI